MLKRIISMAFIAGLAGCSLFDPATPPPTTATPPAAEQQVEEPIRSRAHEERERSGDSQFPEYALKTLAVIRETGRAPEGYEGGRHFMNAEGHLPQSDGTGRAIRYTEWDVHPHGAHNRGTERIVIGSDGTAWFSHDHYRTFRKM